MDTIIEFNPSAFKHGVSEADIRWAFDTAKYDEMQKYILPFNKEGGIVMARMTDEEADYWDEHYTKNPPIPGPNGTGFFSQRRKTARSVTIDNLSADWLLTKAIASNKTPAEIIRDLVQKEIVTTL